MNKAILDGYICVTETVSKPIRDKYGIYFEEIITGRTFDEALRKSTPAFLFNHNRVIASENDIRLYEDNIGLYYQVKTNDIEVIAKAIDEQLKGCSFAFKSLREHDESRKSGLVRIIDKLELHDVSIVDMKPSHRSIVRIVEIPLNLRIKAEEYRKNVLKKKDISEYQKRIDEFAMAGLKQRLDIITHNE